MGVTERPRSLNPSKAIAMAICPIIVHFSTWRVRSMHDVACEFARAAVCSKDAQKQLARTSLSVILGTRVKNAVRKRVFPASGAYLPLKLYAITKQTRFRPQNSKK